MVKKVRSTNIVLTKNINYKISIINCNYHAFYAFPFRKPPELRQLLVDYDPNNSRKLRYVVSPQSNNKIQKFVSSFMANDPASLIHRGFKEFEVSLQSAGFMSKLSQRIADTQGAGLVVDYGFGGEVVGTEENNFKLDTFRGYRKHKQVDVLAYPGETDLTADVDFDFLAKALLYGMVSNSGEWE